MTTGRILRSQEGFKVNIEIYKGVFFFSKSIQELDLYYQSIMKDLFTFFS